MALTLVADAGSASANSFATVAEGDTYHEGHLYATAWTGATDANKAIALVMATRLLDAMIVWSGWKATTAQALQWPRGGMYDRGGIGIDSDIIPTDLKHMTAELARTLLAGDRTADNDADAQGLTSLKVGPVELAFKDRITPKVLADAVFFLMPESWGYVRRRGGSGMVTLERV